MVDPMQYPFWNDGSAERATLLPSVAHPSNPLRICSCDRCARVVYQHAVEPRFAGYSHINPLIKPELTEHQYFLCDNAVEAFIFKIRTWSEYPLVMRIESLKPEAANNFRRISAHLGIPPGVVRQGPFRTISPAVRDEEARQEPDRNVRARQVRAGVARSEAVQCNQHDPQADEARGFGDDVVRRLRKGERGGVDLPLTREPRNRQDVHRRSVETYHCYPGRANRPPNDAGCRC